MGSIYKRSIKKRGRSFGELPIPLVFRFVLILAVIFSSTGISISSANAVDYQTAPIWDGKFSKESSTIYVFNGVIGQELQYASTVCFSGTAGPFSTRLSSARLWIDGNLRSLNSQGCVSINNSRNFSLRIDFDSAFQDGLSVLTVQVMGSKNFVSVNIQDDFSVNFKRAQRLVTFHGKADKYDHYLEIQYENLSGDSSKTPKIVNTSINQNLTCKNALTLFGNSEFMRPDIFYFSSCRFDISQIPNGSQLVDIELLYVDDSSLLAFQSLVAVTSLIEQPIMDLSDFYYGEPAPIGEVATQGILTIPKDRSREFRPAIAFDCFVDNQTVPVTSKNGGLSYWDDFICNPKGYEMPPGLHTVKLVVTLNNGTKIEKTMSVTSNLRVLELPSLTDFTVGQSPTIDEGGLYVKLSRDPFSYTAWCESIEFFAADKSLGLIDTSDRDTFATQRITSDQIDNGLTEFAVLCKTNDGRETTARKVVTVDMLQPAPTVTWSPETINSIHALNANMTISGQVHQIKGKLPAKAKLRSWQFGKGWGAWKAVTLDAAGNFRSKFSSSVANKVQLQLPAHGRTPGLTSTQKLSVAGKIAISAPTKVKAKRWTVVRFTALPKIAKVLHCIETRSVYEDGPEPISWDAEFDVRLANGQGSKRFGWLYPGSDVEIECYIDGSAGEFFWATKKKYISIY